MKVDQKGCFPLKVEMSEDLNPREFALIRYDQSKHPNDLQEYLKAFDKSCAWSWAEDGYDARRDGTSPESTEDSAETDVRSNGLRESDGTENTTASREMDADESSRHASLTEIKGIGETRAAALHRFNIDSVGDVLDASIKDLSRARGVGEVRAERLQEAAEAFVRNGHSVLDPGQPITEIGHLDAQKANALNAAGYETVRDVVDADQDDLAAVEGFDTTSAGFVQEQAEEKDQTDQRAAADGGQQ